MNKFDELYTEMMAGVGGAFGDLGGEEHGGDINNSDWYATGDARMPKALGARKVKSKKKKKDNKGSETTMEIPILRRNINIPM